MRTLNQILADADEIIEKRAAAKTSRETEKTAAAGNHEYGDPDVMKLAEELTRPRPNAVANAQEKRAFAPDTEGMTVFEKVAHAFALTETVLNLDLLTKVAEFEVKAKEQGQSDEAIQGFLEKSAAMNGYQNLFDRIFPAAQGA